MPLVTARETQPAESSQLSLTGEKGVLSSPTHIAAMIDSQHLTNHCYEPGTSVDGGMAMKRQFEVKKESSCHCV